jgi:hypothetical protein
MIVHNTAALESGPPVRRSSVTKIDYQTRLFEKIGFRRWAAIPTLVQDDFAALDSAGHIIGRITLTSVRSPSIWLWHLGIEMSVANGSAFSFENAKSALQFAWTGHKASINTPS